MENESRCPGEGCCCTSLLTRRSLIQLTGTGVLALMTSSPSPVFAGPFESNDIDGVAPADKKLDVQWVKALSARGNATVYRGEALKKIGMPVGGIAAGQLYLGGDGRLWHWDIFNQSIETDGAHYVNPMDADAQSERPLEQGFALLLDGKTHRLDSRDFSDVSFRGQYPIGHLEYSSPDVALAVSLEVFSPFIPLNADDSSLPATIFQFTLKNTSPHDVEALLVGWLQNAVCLFHPDHIARRQNHIVREGGATRLDCSAQPLGTEDLAPDIVFENWQKSIYEGWSVEGEAFGNGPIRRSDIPLYQGDVGGHEERVVNSHASAPGASVAAKDTAVGKLRSRAFRIERDYLHFLIGGGNHPRETAINLVVDGNIVRTATGRDDNHLEAQCFDLHEWRDKTAVIEIVDSARGSWGHIGIGSIVQSDRTTLEANAAKLSDFGELSLTLLGGTAEYFSAQTDLKQLDTASAPDAATASPDEAFVGALGRRVRLGPQQVTTVSFVLTWRFPNLSLPHFPRAGRQYASRFESASAVARYVQANFTQLTDLTKLWCDTWTNSTLPHWFLERTFANTSTLATSTAYRFADGRFYGWEGVGCCAGTCTHVWDYEHAMGRLFPELDISLRERVDYNLNVGFHEDGMIGHRGELAGAAVDGQAGTILRTYRDHQMSPDAGFLRRNWPHIKKAVEWMIVQDGNADGIWEGGQHNTLDAEWFGAVPWLSGLYLAALAAAEQMAQEMGEASFALQCRDILRAGRKNFVQRLWNGEYFEQVPDPGKLNLISSYDGCYIDQVFGQSWALQLGLGRVLPKAETKKALEALWRYNFSPDVGAYRAKRPNGRWFAVVGEGGLLMCSWPRGESKRVPGDFKDGYFNECMSGFEHQVAAHMMSEGMVQESLAIERTIHDRYHGTRRNPWNEIECGDHYARAMASYGVFLAACGYEYHGPKGHLGFAPKISPDNFKAAFTTAQGWGSYYQRITGTTFRAAIALKYGQLTLKTLGIRLPEKMDVRTLRVTLDNNLIKAKFANREERTVITFSPQTTFFAGNSLHIELT